MFTQQKIDSVEHFLTQTLHFSSKIDCKDQNGYGASIKPDIGAGPVSAMTAGAWGGSPGSVGGAAGAQSGGRVGVTTPDPAMRYTPSSVDQAARDRAWMNTCSSLSAAAQAQSHHREI